MLAVARLAAQAKRVRRGWRRVAAVIRSACRCWPEAAPVDGSRWP